MKNIHILPTDKPSRLWTDLNGNFYLHPFPTTLFFMQNIYITSDEEIKDGDWIKWGEAIYKANKKYIPPFKKIILTTDQDLIKDGVQSIDDEFLEWFVKNPSCEKVEVDKGYRGVNLFNYKIIIPKEEPKQEPCDNCNNDVCCCIIRKQETLEEAAEKHLNSGIIPNDYQSFIAGAKEQSKRMYSEEEVKQIIEAALIEHSDFVLADIPDWFEQFKKK
jgi:hypothetical protein